VTSTSPVPSPSRPAANAAPVGGVPRAEVRYVEVDDVHVAYCTVGDGDHDIVIMHPGTLPVDCVLTEPRLAAAIDRLSSFARVTWLDRRGIGLSDRCTADRLPTVDDWVHDLTAVLDAIGSAAPIVYACEDTTVVALELAVRRPERLTGIVLTNAHARFTRSDDYPYGFDPVLAEQSASEVAAAEPPDGGFDLLSLIAPSVAADDDFRSWWDETGRRGATPQVARALRSRHQNNDLRSLIARVDVPVLHLVNPTALAHDPGHDRYLEAHLVHIDTVELPGPDELWWLDRSGIFHAEVERFTREGAPLAARRGERQDRS
jgi:pimeloyl-ACP methyl ester carboxylesterase